jgi:hypothetical protein
VKSCLDVVNLHKKKNFNGAEERGTGGTIIPGAPLTMCPDTTTGRYSFNCRRGLIGNRNLQFEVGELKWNC